MMNAIILNDYKVNSDIFAVTDFVTKPKNDLKI